MTKQFDTFDNQMDRRELVILFGKLGEGLPDVLANEVRAKFLESLIPLSLTKFAESPLKATPSECYPEGAYFIFVQMVGVLGIPIAEAAKRLDRAVTKKEWAKASFHGVLATWLP